MGDESALTTDALDEFGRLGVGVDRATAVANQLKPIVDSQGLAVQIGKSEHLKVEAWVTLGMFCGVSPHTEWTQEVRHPVSGDLEGYKARVQVIRIATGETIGAAECACHFDEQQKRRDGSGLYDRWIEHGRQNRHACMSMAQTRATSKALAQALRWIPVLAGYSGTPFEEMPPDSYNEPPPKPKKQPEQHGGRGGAKPASVQQLRMLGARAAARADELLSIAEGEGIDLGEMDSKAAIKDEIKRLAVEHVGCDELILHKEVDPLLIAIAGAQLEMDGTVRIVTKA